MPKIPLKQNVLEAAKERIAYTFDNFPKIYCSFSGGKDSTTMLHLIMDECIKRDRKIGVLFIDLEGQYKLTIDHIQECYDMYSEYIIPHWLCLPIHLRNAVSVYDPFWVCWDKKEEENWIRKPPTMGILDEQMFPFFRHGMEFEEFMVEYGIWYVDHDGNPEDTACFVGIRTDESLNRFRTLSSTTKQTFEGKQWTTKVSSNLYNIYPIYDWKTQDIWAYHGKNPNRCYNTLYDLMCKAGLTIHQQRICQPYGDDQRRGLWLFQLIEPETWARVVSRVNGANAGAKYIRETGNMTGYRKINLPKGHNWESFAMLLLNSMPEQTRIHYENKITLFCKWWMERGYPDGIPDSAPHEMESNKKVGTWRRVCKSLLRNDYWCKGLSFTQHKSDAYKKYLALMKKRREQQEEYQLDLFHYD